MHRICARIGITSKFLVLYVSNGLFLYFKVNKYFKIIVLLLLFAYKANAQVVGDIVDVSGNPISYASVSYKGHHIAASSDIKGHFSIERHIGLRLTFSSIGYRSQDVLVEASTNNLKITLKEDRRNLSEVVVKAKRGRYTRKDNPAVELMRRVIAAKKRTDLANHEYYQYNKYQKITFGINDLQPGDLENGPYKKSQWLLDQVETCPYNNKLILPLSVDETVTQHLYRKDPKTERDIIKGQQSSGVNRLLQTGDILTTTLKDVFSDIDIYDNHIRLLQYQFTSPIGETAISFYRFYIEDTVYVDKDKCIHLQFVPNNQQDFGFRGELYVVDDSTLHVKRCNLTMPKKSDVNFIDDLKIEQEYTKLANGEWVLTKDDMVAELSLAQFLSKAIAIRTTRLSDYAFDDLPNKLFKGKTKVRHEADAQIRDEAFWNQYRAVELTKGESSMDAFIHRMEQSKNFKWVLAGVKALMENYVETGPPTGKSKFDFGPVNTFISSNFVDNTRLRISGRTTANLNDHLFWNGYYAYGTGSHKSYYGSEVTYSLNKKKNVPFEFPQRNIVFETAYDVMSPSDKFLIHNKDNAFMSIRAQKVEQMYFYNRQKLSFVYETDWGFSVNTNVKAESNEPTGDLTFQRLDNGELVNKIRTTEWTFGLRYNPGQTFINTKQQRMPLNFDAPEFTITHTMGFNNVLGGQYKYNYTEIGIYKRFWLGSWGFLDTHLNGGAQWNKVPFPLLIMPPVNVTLFENEFTFSLMRNMEFLNDRYAFWSAAWDLSGKLLNRIPLIKHLKWREYVAFKGMFGTLTKKNNPFLEENQNDNMLFKFPADAHVMDSHTPYMEVVAGVHNILKFFAIDFIHRFNYNSLPNVKKNGVRLGFEMSF